MKKIILLILIVIVIVLIGNSVYNYYKLKSYEAAFENLSFLILNSYDNYFYDRGKNPDNEKEFSEFAKKTFYKNNRLDIQKENPVFNRGIFIDKYDDRIVFYTSNRRNIKRYKTKNYIWNLDSISYFDYVFKPLKIGLFQSDKLNMCNYYHKDIKLYKNTYRITDKNIIKKIYDVIKDTEYYKKGKSLNFFYLYGKLENNKYRFSILCNDSNYNYNTLIIYADSIYNNIDINKEVDEIYIPFNYTMW